MNTYESKYCKLDNGTECSECGEIIDLTECESYATDENRSYGGTTYICPECGAEMAM